MDSYPLYPGDYSLSVVDDSTYTIELRKGGMGSPLDTYGVYYPRHLLQGLEPSEFAEWEFWTHPVGNGPYRYVRHADRLYRAMWPAFREDLPVTFLQPVVSWTVAGRHVRGLGRPHVLDPMSAVDELWLAEER
ncbi:MAG TPA: hypothetical protein VMM12_18115 [Longimicrobiales bacterium]|nr:hypothetical protein [Longimicrobiales bacterium]